VHFATPDGVYTSMHSYTMTKDGTFSLFSYPPDAPFSMHQGATRDGKFIVGFYREKGATVSRGYILTPADNAVTPVDVPGARSTVIQDISWSGVIIGHYRNPNETTQYHGFVVYTHMSTDKSKWDFKYPVDHPGAPITRMRGINDRGDIVGDYVGTDGKTRAFVASLITPRSQGQVPPRQPHSKAKPLRLPPLTEGGSSTPT